MVPINEYSINVRRQLKDVFDVVSSTRKINYFTGLFRQLNSDTIKLLRLRIMTYTVAIKFAT